ncbi:MAG: hypothetical protein KAI81_06615 [Candidatus Marinimicrobia bacterium]|nr:hypothetical protein [Candidatus Neomarinimicrobiota bacterium]
MSLLWIQSLVVGILLYGIVIFIYGVRNFDDFIQFTLPLNKKKNRVIAVFYLILPSILFASFVDLFMKKIDFFLHPVTLTLSILSIALALLIPYSRKVDWKLAFRRMNQAIRNVITPMQFFLWFFLILFSIALTWFLVGEFWIFNGFVILGLFLVYLQFALIYFFGSYFKRRYIEKQRKQGIKYSGSGKFNVQGIHVFIFITLNILTITFVWFLIGEFWIFNKFNILLMDTIYLIISLIWGFGAIVWKKYLLPMAESDSSVKYYLKTVRAHLVDIIAGIIIISGIILFFVLRPMLMETVTPKMKFSFTIIVAVLLVLYIFIKYILPKISMMGFIIYLGLSLHPADREIISNKCLKNRRIELIVTWLLFLVHLFVAGIAIYFLILWRSAILAYFNMDQMNYYLFYNGSFIVMAIFFIFNNLDSRLSSINHEVSHKRYYISKKRKFLMIELEEIKKKIDEERDVKAKLEDENVTAAIQLLKSKGYQIIISPDTQLEFGKKG